MKKLIAVSLIAMIIAGCGTSAKTIDKEEVEEGVIPQTTKIEVSKVVFQDNSEYGGTSDLIMSDLPPVGEGAAESDAVIEVFNQPQFTDAYKITSAVAENDGTFVVRIDEEDRSKTQTMYVTATAPGKARSGAIIFTR